VTDAPAPAASPTKKPKRSVLALMIAASASTSLVGIGLGIASVIPTNVARLSSEFPAIEDRSHRRAKPGCGLSEVGAPPTCAKAKPASVREEQVTFPSSLTSKGLANLAGTLSLPEGVLGKRPAVVLVHGSGPNTRDEPAPGDLVTKLKEPFPVFKALAELFANEGLVVLRYDKRACRKCYPDWKPDYGKHSWSDYEHDARDGIRYLATRPEVDANAIVVVGHSEGGQIAPFVGHQNPNVAAVIMLAGLTTGFDWALLSQMRRLQEIRRRQWDYAGVFNVWLEVRKYEKCMGKLKGTYDPADRCLGGGVSLGQLAEFIEYESHTLERMKALDVPLMVIQGSVDRNIDPAEMQIIPAGLGDRDYEIHYVPGVNHLMMNALEPKREIDAEVAARLRTFLASVKR